MEPEITWDEITAQNPDIAAPGNGTQVSIPLKYAEDPTALVRALIDACYKAQVAKNQDRSPEEQKSTFIKPAFGTPSVDANTGNFSAVAQYRLNCVMHYAEA